MSSVIALVTGHLPNPFNRVTINADNEEETKMNKCEHATSDQAIVRTEDELIIWCKGCGEEMK